MVITAACAAPGPAPATKALVRRTRSSLCHTRDPASCAAQYVRMSTDHQAISIGMQCEAIEKYAHEHDLLIVRTYADEGKSGLSLHGRAGLNALIEDVSLGQTDFRTILVYDVSRWGRFQDCDEAAHYEFICRRAGIRVEYCTELFKNDGTPMSAVVKSLKRIMAGEYSRELSQKTFAAKCRVVRMGFRVGGAAPFGFRRMLVDPEGRPRFVLEFGQAKCIQNDRVIIVPGPVEEQRIVRWLFRQVAYNHQRPLPLATELNRRKVPTPEGRPWLPQRVSSLLANEVYTGTLVFNRFSTKLRTRRVRNPAEKWIRVPRAWKPIVSRHLFASAQSAMALWRMRVSADESLVPLRALFRQYGRLSERLIDTTPGVPSSNFYASRFGSLLRAYRLVGYRPRRDWRYLAGRYERMARLASLRAEVCSGLRAKGLTVVLGARGFIRIMGGPGVAVMLGRCEPPPAQPRWVIQLQFMPRRPALVLVACLDRQGNSIQDYRLISGGRWRLWLNVGPHPRELGRDPTLEPLLRLIAKGTGAARNPGQS